MTAEDLARASAARADLHRHHADRAWGLASVARERTATRDPDVSRAYAAASRAFWAAGDAHAAAADAHDVAEACNSGDEAQLDEYEYALEATNAARGATKAAFQGFKACEGRDPIGMATEIPAEDAAETAARLVREAEDVAERCLNGR